MKKVFMFLLLILLPNFLFSMDLVTKRTNFYFFNIDELKKETGTEILEKNKGMFNLFWFYDDYCPFTIKSIPELNRFLIYIDVYYPDLVKFNFVEALNRTKDEINYFRRKFNYLGYDFYLSPGMMTNNYLNVDRTPTLIIMDPLGNIVDKITDQTIAIIYIRHLDYIIGKYCSINQDACNLEIDPKKLINNTNEFYLNRLKKAIEKYRELNE